jgi:hypothetical protein
MVNDAGELLAGRGTPAEVNAQEPVGRMARGLWGQLFGDRGDISWALQQALGAQGLALITLLRRQMTPRLMRLWDRRRRRKRCLSETVNAPLKNVSQIEPSRHRRLTGVMVNLVSGLIAYPLQPKKPSLGLRYTLAGLPVVM